MTVEYEGPGDVEERLARIEGKFARELWIWRVLGVAAIILGLVATLAAYYVLAYRGII